MDRGAARHPAAPSGRDRSAWSPCTRPPTRARDGTRTALVGARFDGHPWTQTFAAEVLDPGHPARVHLGDEWEWHDEVYQFRGLRPDARVLLRVRDGELDLDAPGARPPSFGHPLAWCFTEGAGRVFSTSLGHFPTAWESPDYLRHLAGGLHWCCGGTT